MSKFLLPVGLILLLVLVGLPQLLYPLWFDQGVFATCADVLRGGGMMYRDCWDVRGAATPVVYALARVVSSQPIAIHILDLFWQGLTALVLGDLARRLFRSQLSAVFASGLYLLLYGSLNYWAVSQAEGFANLFVVLSIWLGYKQLGSKTLTSAFMAGISIGMTFWFKYPFVAFAVLPILTLAIWPNDPQKNKAILATLAGGFATIAAGLALIVVQGTLPDWWLHIRYDLATFAQVTLQDRWIWLTSLFREEIVTFMLIGNVPMAGWKDTVQSINWLGRGFPPVVFAMTCSLVLLLNSGFTRQRLIAFFYLVLGVALNIWQGHSYRYHFVIWLPAMALCAASSVAGVRFRPLRIISGMACIAAMIGLAASIAPWTADAVSNLFIERKSMNAIHAESKLGDYVSLAAFIEEKTLPAEPSVIFSDVPAVYALANRPMGMAFPYVRWITEGRDLEVTTAYQVRMISQIAARKPRFFILSKDDYPWPTAQFINVWKGWPQLHEYIESHYHYALDIGQFAIFEKN